MAVDRVLLISLKSQIAALKLAAETVAVAGAAVLGTVLALRIGRPRRRHDIRQLSSRTGASWTAANVGIPSFGVGPIAIDPNNHSILYVGVGTNGSTGGVFKSTNGGATSTSAGAGLVMSGVISIAIDPSNSHVIYVSFHCGRR